MAHPGGAPTKYTKELQEAADEYVNGGFVACEDVVPSVAGLSVELGVSRSSLYLWGRQYPKFSNTLDRLKSLQERITLSGGLRGDLNSTIVKLLLANHGYSDKQEVDHRSGDGSMSPKDSSAAVLAALKAKHEK